MADWLTLLAVVVLLAAYLVELRHRWRSEAADRRYDEALAAQPEAEVEWHGGLERLVPRQRIIVNTTTGHAFAGVLWRHDGEFIILKAAELLERAGAKPIDGEVVLDVRKVDFVQAPPQAAS